MHHARNSRVYVQQTTIDPDSLKQEELIAQNCEEAVNRVLVHFPGPEPDIAIDDFPNFVKNEGRRNHVDAPVPCSDVILPQDLYELYLIPL